MSLTFGSQKHYEDQSLARKERCVMANQQSPTQTSDSSRPPDYADQLKQLLPKSVAAVLTGELDNLEGKRLRRIDLLTEKTNAEKDYLQQWLSLPEPTGERQYRDVGKWIAALKGEHEKLKGFLAEKKEAIQAKEEELKDLDAELKVLFQDVKSVRRDLHQVSQQVETLEETLSAMKADKDTPQGRQNLIEEQIKAAKMWQKSLEDMLPDKEQGPLYDAIDEALKVWRKARADLMTLTVGPATGGDQERDDLESLELDIEKILIQITYLEKYQAYLEGTPLKQQGSEGQGQQPQQSQQQNDLTQA
jgi:chromosome segregation ATPase